MILRAAMGHVAQDTSWCTIDIDTAAGKVVVLERWQYVWKVESSRMTRWTLAEKQEFHAIPVFMDIRWVLAKPHWTVHVTKLPKGKIARSIVYWTPREIHVDSNDFMTRETCFGPPKNACASQIPVAHEFGHTIGNIGTITRQASDEYSDGVTEGTKRSPHLDDIHSMMHRGNQLRERHFEHLMTELHDLMPDPSFSVGRLQ